MYSALSLSHPSRSFYHIDYVAFPMSFVVENGSVILLYGKQDCDAWVAKINLQGLLQSLVPVETKVEINSYYAQGGKGGAHGGQGPEGESEGERQGYGREGGRGAQPVGTSASTSAGANVVASISTSASTSTSANSINSVNNVGARRLTKRPRQIAA